MLYLDCFSGVAGDMMLGALLDLGLPLEGLRSALGSLAIDYGDVAADRVLRAGVSATKFRLIDANADATDPRRSRPGHDSPASSSAPSPVAHRRSDPAVRVVGRGAGTGSPSVRAARRGRSRDPRHADRARPPARGRRPRLDHRHRRRRVRASSGSASTTSSSSPLNVGGGTVHVRARRVSRAGAGDGAAARRRAVYGNGHDGAGDADRRAARDGLRARVRAAAGDDASTQIGYGAGDRDPEGHAERAAHLPRRARAAPPHGDRIVKIECEIDDMNPQLFGPLMDDLLAAGALDVFYTPVQMKKNRPGTLVTVDRAARSARELSPTSSSGVDDDRRALRRDVARVPGSRDGVGRHAVRRGAVQGRAPRRRGAERRAGVRRLRTHRRRARRRRSRPFRPQPSRHASTACDNRSDVPFLPHDGDRLREQPSPPRDRLREDHRRRDRALPAAARGRDLVRHGQRRALAERLSPRPRGRSRSAGVLRSDGAGVQRPSGIGSTSRTTTSSGRPSRGITPPCRSSCGGSARLATSTRAPTKAGTASAARRSSRRRISSTASCPLHSAVEWITREEPLLPAVDVSRHAARSISRRIRSSSSRTSAATRSCGCSRRASRTSRSAAPASHWGIPVPDDPDSVVYVWFDALINYAAAVGFGTDRERVRALVAGRPARDRQGHHALPHRDLAGDADERRACRCRGRSSATGS